MKKEFLLSVLGGCLLLSPEINSQVSAESHPVSIPGLAPADLNFPELNMSADMQRLLEYYSSQGFPSEDQFQQMGFLPQRNKLVSKAPADGCFYGIGDDQNRYIPLGMDESECADCENSGGIIKHNQSYVWGMTNDEKSIYWGTNFNYVCTGRVEVTLKSLGKLEGFEPYANECLVCEFDKAAGGYGENLNKDWRPPRIYRYDKESGKTKDITPDTNTDPNINKAFGLRSAGTYKNWTVIAGPNSLDHISMYWYDNSIPMEDESNGYIGSWTMTHLPGYENKIPFNVRRWIVANEELYCAVEYVDKGNSKQKGAVLRWKREVPFNKEIDGGDPSFYFEVVGWTAGGAGDLCLMNDRIYVSTMPSMTICQGPKMYGKPLPAVKNEGETPWPEVFSYMKYDPDPLCKNAVAGGALIAYKNKLYFGTMHIPMQFALYAPKYYGENVFNEPSLLLKTILGTQRASAIFRLSENEDGTPPVVELLYGETELPAFNFQTKEWEIKSTNMTPLYGKSGFNNAWNNYTWAMSVVNDKLYVGTQDWTCMWVPMLKINIPLPDPMWNLLEKVLKETNLSGYDVLCFEDNDSPAKIVTTNGFNVSSSYGVRNMVNDGKKLYIGSASGHNLAETGGWEIVEVTDEFPLLNPDIRWERKEVTYGENWKEQLPLAKAKVALIDVPGSYDYSINHTPLCDIDKLEPGTYKLRVNFTPDELQLFKPEASMTKLSVNKAKLDVIGKTIEVTEGDPIEENIFGYTMKGFVYNENPDVLEQKPTAKLPVIPTVPGNYEIVIEGGKSDLYDFNYINGELVIKVISGMINEQIDQTKLFPIPCKDKISIQSQLKIKRIEILDLSGAIVYSIKNPKDILDLSSLSAGVYVVTINTEEGNIIRKITKE